MLNSLKIDTWFYRQEFSFSQSKRFMLLLSLIVLLGMALRLWGLGDIGLHGDEETTSLAALAVLDSGAPLMPSGMLYPRSIPQSYLIALSVAIFGVSEWAIRLPSALAGGVVIFLSFFLGKRFLPPLFNFLFVLIISLSPWMIQMSQTARMYIFFSAACIGFAVLIMRWEEKDTYKRMIAAFGGYLIAQLFHTLAIFSAVFFFWPFLARPSTNRFVKSCFAFFAAFLLFSVQRRFESMQYNVIKNSTAVLKDYAAVSADRVISPFQYLMINHYKEILFVFLISIAIITIRVTLQKNKNNFQFLAAGIWILAPISAVFLQYHIAAIILSAGAIFYLRFGGKKREVFIAIFLFAMIPAIQFYLLKNSEMGYSIRAICKAFLGSFSISPYIAFFGQFPVCLALYAVPFLYALWEASRRDKIPYHFLLFIVFVWVPLILEGFFKWYIFTRYTFQLLPFFVLCSLAGAWFIKDKMLKILHRPLNLVFLLCIVAMVTGFIQPLELIRKLNSDPGMFPDHKGAANFVKSIELKPQDLVIVEDMLMQKFYLKRIDYWLRSFKDAKHYVTRKDGKLVDIYTHTPLIGSGVELENIIKRQARGDIYLIGSGETADAKKYYLGNGIQDIIDTYKPRALFTGVDNKTKVLVFP